uniref:Uncharacterized protein n=1 Tax=Aegilops tauschii TaxID=37682 RepID=N1R0S1_AEGTA
MQLMFPLEPKILTTETNGGLVILRAVVGNNPSDSVLLSKREYFVYDPRAAKLDHLPHPGRQHEFDEYTLAIVRKCSQHCQRTSTTTTTHQDSRASLQEHHCDCTYVVAAQAISFTSPETSHLCMYHSDTKTWSKKPVMLNSYPHCHATSKTLTIGGDKGTVAWIDLWQSIIFCDILDEQPKLRCLELPKRIMPKNKMGHGDPRSIGDIAAVATLKPPIIGRPSHAWSISISSFSREDWTRDHHMRSTRIPPPSSLHQLMVDAGIKAAHPTLSTLHVGLPNISLQNDDIVYFLAKIDYCDRHRTAWVLGVDMRNETVKEVCPFDSKRTLGLGRGYDASRISAYLEPALGN